MPVATHKLAELSLIFLNCTPSLLFVPLIRAVQCLGTALRPIPTSLNVLEALQLAMIVALETHEGNVSPSGRESSREFPVAMLASLLAIPSYVAFPIMLMDIYTLCSEFG